MQTSKDDFEKYVYCVADSDKKGLFDNHAGRELEVCGHTT
jgi:hypothetical protein